MDVSAAASIAPVMYATPRPAAQADDGGFGFDDLLDIVNPLQHIPIIGTIYRELTGDEIGGAARVAGGALFGGVLGALGSVATIALEGIVGESTDEMITSFFDGSLFKGSGDGDTPSQPTQYANDPYRAHRAYAAAKSLTETAQLITD